MQHRVLVGAVLALLVAVAPAAPAATPPGPDQDRSWTGGLGTAYADDFRLGWAVGWTPTRPGRLTSASLALYDVDIGGRQTGVALTLSRADGTGEPGGTLLGTVRVEAGDAAEGECLQFPGEQCTGTRWVDLELERPVLVEPSARYWLSLVPDEPLVYGLLDIAQDRLEQGAAVRQELRILDGGTGSVRTDTGTTPFRSFLAPRAATSLVAAPAVGAASGADEFHATLTSGGLPQAGRTVSFRQGELRLCTATTDADGRVACRPALRDLLATDVQATFDGDADLAPSTATRALLVLPAGRAARR